MSAIDFMMREARSAYIRNLEITLPASIVAVKYPKEVARFIARTAGAQIKTTYKYKKETLRNLTKSAKQIKKPINMTKANKFVTRRLLPIAAAYTIYQGFKNFEDYYIVTDYGLM